MASRLVDRQLTRMERLHDDHVPRTGSAGEHGASWRLTPDALPREQEANFQVPNRSEDTARNED
jgi:hypothetical protein